MKVEHKIDLAHLKEFAHLGVRRAIIFLGLGLNAAHREDFVDYEMSKLPGADKRGFPIRFFPDALPTERIHYFKTEFARWIQECCLCDLLEHHAIFLDKLHFHALVVLHAAGKLNPKDDPKKLDARFRHEGISGKHRTLKERFAITTAHSGAVDQLYEARNALTHDFGVVMPKRCDADGKFIMRVPEFSFIAVGDETGTERPLSELMGQVTSEPTSILLRIGQRELIYKQGERIEAQVDDIEDICHFFAGWAIPSMLSAFVDFLAAHNVTAHPT